MIIYYHSSLTGQDKKINFYGQNDDLIEKVSFNNLLEVTIMKNLIFCLLLGVLVVSSGCWAIFVGIGAVGAYSYSQGELERTYPADFPKTWEATRNVLEGLEFEMGPQQKDNITGHIQAKMADGTSIYVKVKMVSSDTTLVGIRVGTFGDRVISEHIHDKIRDKLRIPERESK